MEEPLTPFELDVLEQPTALRRLAGDHIPTELVAAVIRDWDRIVFTGMGSSHFAGLPTWRTACATGRSAWSIDTGRLLDTPELITPSTLVIATSQSGASGEIVELANRIEQGSMRPGLLVGVTDDLTSPLASAAGLGIPLHSGPEATVSTKSYLNTLGVHRAISQALTGGSLGQVGDELWLTAESVERTIAAVSMNEVARAALSDDSRRIAMVGRFDDAATAQFSALITKESSKVAAEGFIGGQFRHGPFELAGRGLTALLFGVRAGRHDESLRRLATDLVETGSRVLLVGDESIEGATTIDAPGAFDLEGLATGAVVAELFAVALARANGVTPGAFAYGSKITTAL